MQPYDHLDWDGRMYVILDSLQTGKLLAQNTFSLLNGSPAVSTMHHALTADHSLDTACTEL
jgi:hypothetical protein